MMDQQVRNVHSLHFFVLSLLQPYDFLYPPNSVVVCSVFVKLYNYLYCEVIYLRFMSVVKFPENLYVKTEDIVEPFYLITKSP